MTGIEDIKGFLDIRESRFLAKMTEDVVNRFQERSILCEIGSFYGKSTVSIAQVLRQKNKGILYAIDWHQGSPELKNGKEFRPTYEEYLTNLKKFDVADRVVTVKERSEKSNEQVPQKIHLLWIDGLHEFDAVKSDFDNYHSKITDGGYLLFHDACWTSWTGPFRLINEKILDNPDYNLFAVIGHIMAFKKEPNKTKRIYKNILRFLVNLTIGTPRPLSKRFLSSLCRQMTYLYWNVRLASL